MPKPGEEAAGAVTDEGLNTPGIPSYQDLLRAIGAFFDASGAEDVTVFQVDAGFVARFHGPESGSESKSRHFAVGELMHDAEAAKQRPQRRAEGTRRERSYENILRTLGWELDEVAAATVTIDELPSELYVSWLARNPQEGLAVIKRHATLGLDALSTMLHDAEGRRRPGVLHPGAPGEQSAVHTP